MTHFIGGNNPNIGFMKFCEVVNKEILICNRESDNPRDEPVKIVGVVPSMTNSVPPSVKSAEPVKGKDIN